MEWYLVIKEYIPEGYFKIKKIVIDTIILSEEKNMILRQYDLTFLIYACICKHICLLLSFIYMQTYLFAYKCMYMQTICLLLSIIIYMHILYVL